MSLTRKVLIGTAIAFFVLAAVCYDGQRNVNAAAEDPTTVPAVTTSTTLPTTTTTSPPLEAGSSRTSPVPVGDTVQLGEWEITVNGFNPNATEAVMAENQFNDPPVEDRVFVLIEATFTYVGNDSATITFDTILSVVGVSGVTFSIGPDDRCGVIPDALDEWTEVFTGGVLSGNLCYSVPVGDVEGLVLIVKEFLGDGRHFMATAA